MNREGHSQSAEVASLDSVPAVSKPARHRVLLVEDHADLAEATAELMRFHGLEVRIATTGSDALEMAKQFNPVLILCDLILPDVTGLAIAQALRRTCGPNDLLIAVYSAMSADALRDLERHTNPHEVDLFLSKPLTNQTLISILSRLEALRPR